MTQAKTGVAVENYYQTFNADKNVERMLYRDGYVLQGRELNDVQEMDAYRLKNIADALFADGDVIRDAQISVNAQTGEVRRGVPVRRGARGSPGDVHHSDHGHGGRGRPHEAKRGQ